MQTIGFTRVGAMVPKRPQNASQDAKNSTLQDITGNIRFNGNYAGFMGICVFGDLDHGCGYGVPR